MCSTGLTLSTRRAGPRGLIRFYSNSTGNKGSDIYTHPHFIPYLRYFLFGAELPAGLIAEFEQTVGDPQYVTSSDVVPISRAARELTRRHQIDRADAPEEFFKLCLDIGLSLNFASAVMQSVKQVR